MVTFNLDMTLLSIISISTAFLAAAMALVYGIKPMRRMSKADIRPGLQYPDAPDSEPEEENPDTSGIQPEPESEEGVIPDSGSENPEEYILREEKTQPISDGLEWPKVSVIAHATEEGELLDSFITSFRNQEYPYAELILVLDAGVETRDMFVEKYADIPGLYLTFIPPGSQNLSRRKLATTIGMKAAGGDVALVTATNCRIPSRMWLREMMRPFAESRFTEVALGMTHPDNVGAGGLRGRYRRWYSACTEIRWGAYALAGKPYRGDGLNLAFRRELFFNHKGYARTINLHNGDDDLFISEICNAGNTVLILSPHTRLTAVWGEIGGKMWASRREHYDFTSRWLPRGSFRREAVFSACQWTALAGCITAACGSLPNLLPAAAGLLLMLIMIFWEGTLYRKAAAAVDGPRLCLTLPLFIFWKPIGNFIFRLRHRSERVKNFTWQRHH